MIRKIVSCLLMLIGVCLLVNSSLWTYFTLAGGEEREAVANGTTTYDAQFVNLMFGFDIPAIAIQSWIGILLIVTSFIVLLVKNKANVADTFS